MKIFIIHCTGGSPKSNWFPWLKSELEKLGHEVFVPTFPTPEGQSLSNWMDVFEVYTNKVDKNSILVGHSIGPAFLLNVLEKANVTVKACFFVSGFIGSLGLPQYDGINYTFTEKNFNWDKIRSNCKKFYIFHGDNDPLVPLSKANELAEKLNAELVVIKNGGHLNQGSGFLQFPQLLKEIKRELLKALVV
ncbi:serine hydrolase family protein [Candidatus Micrarchaeota archaeon]|nr:serine hydrolase family protein [Candidatus Micrarchaeota archaeon]